MSRDNTAGALAACAILGSTLMLAACGGSDNAASAAQNQSDAAQAGVSPGMTSYQNNALQLAAGASIPLSQLQAPPLVSAEAGSAVASAQASIAADAQQFAPVMHYAPGDGPDSAQ
ncbi:hypothetical protein [Paraburkholderia jirisanensis]